MPDSISFDALVDILSALVAQAARKTSGTPAETIDPDASLTSFGLDSMAMVELVSALEEQLDRELEPELAFNYPTINALARHLSAQPATVEA
ncbi:acyl carrier protein [Actibacterium sp. XHP0104]|uniref:acyl carrier protein n=1 Tax=Actibacterium sp. XHP0104 TaxID=2984335 RepID=UPI0021E6E561|nr:acyl carrier protein [Actibacterium sp. XHP0104]MCV2881304.1 acyl carrier protein [Actibacterium sp. XHP0104]